MANPNEYSRVIQYWRGLAKQALAERDEYALRLKRDHQRREGVVWDATRKAARNYLQRDFRAERKAREAKRQERLAEDLLTLPLPRTKRFLPRWFSRKKTECHQR